MGEGSVYKTSALVDAYFGPEVGKTETAMQAEFRLKDRKKSGQIFGHSIIVGIVIAVLAYFI
jgi:hypothetical protein